MIRIKIFTMFVFLSVSVVSSSQTINYTHNGLTRQYIYYEPEGITAQAPLVFVLHGYSGDAFSIRDYTQMNEVADEHKFAVCYPQGTKDEWSNNFWNVGYEFHATSTVDDVDFICELGTYLQTEYNLSKQNTFVTGMSNGGDMSFLLSCQGNNVFKAFAAVCGTIMNNRFDYCIAPVPIFAINGNNDNTTWYDGDPDNIGKWGPYLGIPEIIDRFVEVNECTANSTESLPNTVCNDGSSIEFDRYYNGLNRNEVWLYRVINGGHDWPGGSGNMDINASEEVWKFFTQYVNNTATPLSNNTRVNDFVVYPNPSNGQALSISAQMDDLITVSIINASGITIYAEKFQSLKGEIITFNKQLKKGIYGITLSSNELVLCNKLVVY